MMATAASQDATQLVRGRKFSERLMTAVFWTVGVVIVAAFGWLAGSLVQNGAAEISWEFLTAAPRSGGRSGGVFPVIVSTLGVLSVALATAVPLSVATAIWLTEFTRGRTIPSRFITGSLDLLASVPSIVFGLFGNAFFCRTLGLGYSLLAGGLTLACMVLPILIRALESSLRSVPDDYRVAGAALGVSRTRLTFAVLLPVAIPGLLAGIVLGIGRVLAETAALLFTSGYGDRLPSSLLDSGRTLSIHLYDLAMNVPGGEPRAAATALLLSAILVTLNLGSLWLLRTLFAPQPSGGT